MCIAYQEEVFVNFTPLKCTTHIKTQVLKNVQIADRWRLKYQNAQIWIFKKSSKWKEFFRILTKFHDFWVILIMLDLASETVMKYLENWTLPIKIYHVLLKNCRVDKMFWNWWKLRLSNKVRQILFWPSTTLRYSDGFRKSSNKSKRK